MTLKLSVLDQSVARVGLAQDASIRQTLELAQHCEALGYERFWVSEHHSIPAIVGSAPEVLMAAIAARTRRIRIGSAGVMLPHYATYKVAEQFRVLDALAPGRIDLGVGRAPGGDMRTARLLNPHAGSADDFPRQVLELQAWVNGQPMPPGHPGHGVQAHPMGATAPQLWMLGSSAYGAQLAAHYGMPYAFAHFITDGEGAGEALDLYRQHFKPGFTDRPQATVCVWALAADTDGIDGMEDNAGAVVTPDTLARAAVLGLKVGDHLARNDAYGFFEPLGDLVVTGPTHTNVNDFRAILVK